MSHWQSARVRIHSNRGACSSHMNCVSVFVCSQKHERWLKIINDCSVFHSHLLWRRRGNSLLCFSGIWHMSRGDCILTVCLLCFVACVYWYFLKGSIDCKEKNLCVSTASLVLPSSALSPSVHLVHPLPGLHLHHLEVEVPPSSPSCSPLPVGHRTLPRIWNWFPANPRPESWKLLNLREREREREKD